MAVKVDENKCTGCGICIDVCPVGAITVDDVAKIDSETCTGCCACINECPNNAIFRESKGAESSFRKYDSSLSSRMPITEDARPLPPRRGFGQQSDVKQANAGGGLLGQVFDFLGKTTNAGRGQGRGQGRGGGRGCGGGGRGHVGSGRGGGRRS